MAEYQLSPKVRAVMSAECIGEEEMQHMLSHSAISSITGGNRRFHHWLFLVNGLQAQDMVRVEFSTVGEDRGEGFTEDVCFDCELNEIRGCQACGWRGILHVWNLPEVR